LEYFFAILALLVILALLFILALLVIIALLVIFALLFILALLVIASQAAFNLKKVNLSAIYEGFASEMNLTEVHASLNPKCIDEILESEKEINDLIHSKLLSIQTPLSVFYIVQHARIDASRECQPMISAVIELVMLHNPDLTRHNVGHVITQNLLHHAPFVTQEYFKMVFALIADNQYEIGQATASLFKILLGISNPQLDAPNIANATIVMFNVTKFFPEMMNGFIASADIKNQTVVEGLLKCSRVQVTFQTKVQELFSHENKLEQAFKVITALRMLSDVTRECHGAEWKSHFQALIAQPLPILLEFFQRFGQNVPALTQLTMEALYDVKTGEYSAYGKTIATLYETLIPGYTTWIQ